jgi:hypothetical protein
MARGDNKRRMAEAVLVAMETKFNVNEFVSAWIDIHGTCFAPTTSMVGNFLCRKDSVEHLGKGRWRKKDA